jgi:hypothetical protein
MHQIGRKHRAVKLHVRFAPDRGLNADVARTGKMPLQQTQTFQGRDATAVNDPVGFTSFALN